MTNENYIKSLDRKSLAIALINTSEVPDYYDDDGDNDISWGVPIMQTLHTTSDGMEFWDDYEGALEHECWWLAQEREDEED